MRLLFLGDSSFAGFPAASGLVAKTTVEIETDPSVWWDWSKVPVGTTVQPALDAFKNHHAACLDTSQRHAGLKT